MPGAQRDSPTGSEPSVQVLRPQVPKLVLQFYELPTPVYFPATQVNRVDYPLLSSFLFLFVIILFLKINLFIYLHFIFGCIGSLLQRTGATLCCSARASHCGGFSCCRARALGARASVVAARGLQ